MAGRKVDLYRCMDTIFHVTDALLLLEQYPREPVEVPTAELRNELILPPDQAATFIAGLEADRIARVDLSFPVVRAWWFSPCALALAGVPMLVTMDGNHRVRKAVLEGQRTLPAYQLTPEESWLVQHPRPDHPRIKLRRPEETR